MPTNKYVINQYVIYFSVGSGFDVVKFPDVCLGTQRNGFPPCKGSAAKSLNSRHINASLVKGENALREAEQLLIQALQRLRAGDVRYGATTAFRV